MTSTPVRPYLLGRDNENGKSQGMPTPKEFSDGQTARLVPLGHPFLPQRPTLLHSPCSYTRLTIQATQNSRTNKSPLAHEPRDSKLTTHPIKRVRVAPNTVTNPPDTLLVTHNPFSLPKPQQICRLTGTPPLPSPPPTEIRSNPRPTLPFPGARHISRTRPRSTSPPIVPSDHPFKMTGSARGAPSRRERPSRCRFSAPRIMGLSKRGTAQVV